MLALAVGCSPQTDRDLTIAVAANMQFAMDEILQGFREKTGLECDMVVSSSGKLTAQIMEGAPFDILVSADMKYPQALYQAGLATEAPVVYAYGKLVLWTTKDRYKPSIDGMLDQQVKHIAIANPKTAPYGEAAEQVLHYHDIFEAVQPKLVFGESISQTNQFIISGAAEVGFTAKAVVLSESMKGRGQWIEIDSNQHKPIAQGVVIIDSENAAFSRQFFDFLLSPEGQLMLQKYGYDAGE